MISEPERLQAMIQHAYTHAPAVRRRFEAAGLTPADIQTRADLAKLPILPKDELISLQQADPPFGGLLAVPLADLHHIFMSPGPIYEPDGGEESWGSAKIAFGRGQFQPGDIVLNTLSYHLVPAGLALDKVLVELGCTVVPSGFGNTDLQLKLLRDLKITGYVGTPSFLMNLIHQAEKQGHNFRQDYHLTKALVSAEPLTPALRQTLTETYGLHILNAYATAELGILAIADTPSLAMDLLPEPIIELVHPDTGQPVAAGEAGEVVVTNFSHVYPMIRLGTGDLALNLDPNFGESTQAERQIIIVGRSGDAIKVRGMFVHPNQLRFAIQQVLAMQGLEPTRFQGAVQRTELRDEFVIRLTDIPQDKHNVLRDSLALAIQQACRVRVDKIEYLSPDELPANGREMVDERQWD